VLRLEHDSLTKEIRLTQDLLQLFIEYHIPSDMLSFGGPSAASAAARIASVQRNVRAMQLIVDCEKVAAELEALNSSERTEIELAIEETLAARSSHASLG
jgi:hypothetical protein